MPDTQPDTDTQFPTQPDTEGERKMSFPPTNNPSGPRQCVEWYDYVRVTIGTLIWLAICFGPLIAIWWVTP